MKPGWKNKLPIEIPTMAIHAAVNGPRLSHWDELPFHSEISSDILVSVSGIRAVGQVRILGMPAGDYGAVFFHSRTTDTFAAPWVRESTPLWRSICVLWMTSSSSFRISG